MLVLNYSNPRYIVYKVENTINGKIYIGLTQRKLRTRISDHISLSRAGSDRPFHRALIKYGIVSFKIAEIDCAPSLKEIREREKYWIKYYDCKAPKGYNLTDGGDGLSNPTLEIRTKISKAHTGRKLSEKHREKAIKTLALGREYFRGKKFSAEHLRNLSQSHKGKKQSEETKRKRSEALKAAHKRLGNKWNNRKMEINAKGQFVRALPESSQAAGSAVIL